MFGAVLSVISSFAIILMRVREAAFVTVSVLRLFLTVSLVGCGISSSAYLLTFLIEYKPLKRQPKNCI